MYSRNVRYKPFDLIIFALLGAVVAFFAYRIDVGLNYKWAWHKIPQFLFRFDTATDQWTSNIIMWGLYNTLRLSIWGILLASIFGTLMGIARSSNILFFRLISGTYVESMRNLPPLVIIYIVYFFIGDQIMPADLGSLVEESPSWVRHLTAFCFAPSRFITAFFSALLTLAIFEGAYITEIVRAGIQSIGKGQWEAARAVGLSPFNVLRDIVMPQAIRNILPPLAGQFITLIKDSAIISLISIQELTFVANEVAATTTRVFETWILVGAMYFVLCYSFALLFAHLERRAKRSQR